MRVVAVRRAVALQLSWLYCPPTRNLGIRVDGTVLIHQQPQQSAPRARRQGGRLSSARQARQVVARMAVAEQLIDQIQRDCERLHAATSEMQSRVRIPLRGYAEQSGAASGYWADGWIGKSFAVSLLPELRVRHVEVRLWQPADRWQVQSMQVSVGAHSQALALWPGQGGRLDLKLALPAQQPFTLTINALHSWRAKANDGRELAAQLLGVWLWH